MFFLSGLYSILIFSLSVSDWPVAERKGLFSTFAEWRYGHLHAGIDIPTKMIGEEVSSVSDGWVMRVKTSPWGYGKVVYIRSGTGETYVYAHLSSFFEELDQIVRKEQLKKFSYATEIWFPEEKLPVSKGDIIGYTGRSGCMGAHLHFELRDKNNNPVDPFQRGFSVADTIPPVIEAIRFVPLDESSKVSGSHIGKVFPAVGDTISVYIEGKVGIEIETFDKVNGRSGRLGPKEIRLYQNNELIRKEYFDKFSYSNYKDSRFLFDFPYQRKTGRKFRRLFNVNGNDFTFYEGQDGIITGGDTANYLIEVYDGRRNVAFLNINLLDSPENGKNKENDSGEKGIVFSRNGFLLGERWFGLRRLKAIVKSGDSLFIWNLTKKNFRKFETPDKKCILTLWGEGKVNTKLIAVKVSGSEPGIWSWEPQIALRNKAKMRIKMPEGEDNFSIYEKNGSDWSFCSSSREGEYLVEYIDHLGSFGVLKDSIAPVVSLKNKYFTPGMSLQINLRDSLSGVDFYSIKTFIDGEQTVFRYDPQRERLIFEYPEEISEGKHSLELFLKDRQGNIASKVWEIFKK